MSQVEGATLVIIIELEALLEHWLDGTTAGRVQLVLHLLDELVLLLIYDLSSVIIINVDVKVLHLEVDLVKHFHHLLGKLLSLEAIVLLQMCVRCS